MFFMIRRGVRSQLSFSFAELAVLARRRFAPVWICGALQIGTSVEADQDQAAYWLQLANAARSPAPRD